MTVLRRIIACFVLFFIGLTVPGCDSGSNREVICVTNPGADLVAARKLNARALEHLRAGYPPGAEEHALAALEAYGDYGPAYNTLGLVCLEQGRLNEAARNFNLAASNMPRDPSPYYNLGLVWEKAGRMEQAAAEYRKALKIDPDNITVTANLARALVLAGKKDDETRRLLKEVILKDARAEWVRWAERTLKLMPEKEDYEFELFEGGMGGGRGQDREKVPDAMER